MSLCGRRTTLSPFFFFIRRFYPSRTPRRTININRLFKFVTDVRQRWNSGRRGSVVCSIKINLVIETSRRKGGGGRRKKNRIIVCSGGGGSPFSQCVCFSLFSYSLPVSSIPAEFPTCASALHYVVNTHIYIINNVSIRLTGPFGVESRADHRYPPPSETRGPFERGKFGLSLSSLSLSGVNQKKIGRAAAEIAWRSRKKEATYLSGKDKVTFQLQSLFGDQLQ